MLRVSVVRFPGSNCDWDAFHAVERAGARATFVWHRDTDLQQAELVILPGGFSYGDYLRSGAIARFSPVMQAVQRHAAEGGAVLGICNGFQILCEAHLLPGALVRNDRLTFVSRPVWTRVERTDTFCTNAFERRAELRIPVAHGDGCYVADEDTVRLLEAEGRVVLRYIRGENPNGSVADIAGVSNAAGTVVGFMPHPERAVDPLTGSDEGAAFFRSISAWLPGGATRSTTRGS